MRSRSGSTRTKLMIGYSMTKEYRKVQRYYQKDDGTFGFKMIALSPEFELEWRRDWNNSDFGSKYPKDSL